MLTYIPMEEVKRLSSLEGEKINEAKKIAAFEITKLIHGEEEAIKAQEAAEALFEGKGSLENMPTIKMEEDKNSLIDILVLADIVSSKGQARKLIEQGGITLNDEKVTDVTYVVDEKDLENGYAILKKGKKVFYKIEK